MIRPGLREWFAIGRVFANGHLLRTDVGGLGTCVRFERDLAAFTGADHTLAVSSGTAGLFCALQACGIGPGDEVLVPAYTWMATAAAVLQVGAVPVLVEIDTSLTMDVADLEAKITKRSRAVIPVHMINRPCDMGNLMRVARSAGLIVIEDAAQAVGVRHRGQACGTIGDIGVFSFNQHKNMTCGEGGAILTNDPALFARSMNAHDMGINFRDGAQATAQNGNTPIFLGGNFRISEIQGAILGVQLKRLRRRVRRMRARAELLERILGDAGLPVAPQNDSTGGLGLALTFDTEEAAIAFARQRGVRRLFDNSKHVYTEWQPILARQTFHPAFNPWAWAEVEPTRQTDDCPRTLDLLRRSCAVNLMPELPLAAVRLIGKRLAG